MKLRNENLTHIEENKMTGELDWSEFEGGKYQCRCTCGVDFSSYAQYDYKSRKKLITKDPCPGCGKDDKCWTVHSDPEQWEL